MAEHDDHRLIVRELQARDLDGSSSSSSASASGRPDDYFDLLAQLTSAPRLDAKDALAIWRLNNNTPGHHCFVCELRGILVGTITLVIEKKFIHGGGMVGHVEDLVVDAASRRKGVGRALLDKAVAVARQHECYKIILDCDEHNVPFYSTAGFQNKGTIQMSMYLPETKTPCV